MPNTTASFAQKFPAFTRPFATAVKDSVRALVHGEKGGDDRLQWAINAATDDTKRSTVLTALRLGHSHIGLRDMKINAPVIVKKKVAAKGAAPVVAAPVAAPVSKKRSKPSPDAKMGKPKVGGNSGKKKRAKEVHGDLEWTE